MLCTILHLLHSSNTMEVSGEFLPKPCNLEGVSLIPKAIFPAPVEAAA